MYVKKLLSAYLGSLVKISLVLLTRFGISQNFYSLGGESKIRFETEQNGSEQSGTDTQHAVRSVSTRFLLNYEAKGWSKANFFFISMKPPSSGGAGDIIEPPQAVKISEI
jgi:hypothetical protein